MTARSPRDPDEPDVEREADEGEDGGLRAMRSVWLSMRDEEPPAAGLAELMAAARAKATELAPAPWWRRALAGLRRPPVMALATALVVLGGGAFVATRVKHEAAMPVARSQDQVAREGRAASDDQAASEQSGPATEAASAETVSTRAPADTPASASEKPERLRRGRVSASASAPSGSGSNGGSTGGTASAIGQGAPGGRAPSDEASRSLRASATPLEATVQPAPSVAKDTVPRAPAAKQEAVTGSRYASPPKPSKAKPSARVSGALIDTDAESIYEQCARAAARGDCARVKQLVEQISATDRQYRARLKPSSEIARCLTAP